MNLYPGEYDCRKHAFLKMMSFVCVKESVTQSEFNNYIQRNDSPQGLWVFLLKRTNLHRLHSDDSIICSRAGADIISLLGSTPWTKRKMCTRRRQRRRRVNESGVKSINYTTYKPIVYTTGASCMWVVTLRSTSIFVGR